MAHTYSYLYQLPTTELRFLLFMDLGEDLIWPYLSLPKNILEEKSINVFNHDIPEILLILTISLRVL